MDERDWAGYFMGLYDVGSEYDVGLCKIRTEIYCSI